MIVQGPTWEEAEANAVKLGGHLVTINDAAENQWLAENLKDINKGYNNNADVDIYWTGLEKSSGSWRWISGEAFSYTNWGPLEPFEDNGRNDRAEIIVQAYPGAAAWTVNSGNWNNAPNTYNRYGIAEIKLSSAPPTPTYNLSTSSSINEGSTLTTTVSTTNVHLSGKPTSR